ncbi:hypothetical protein NC651_039715 [Populus alba x Populus x berolinensis]|nr:hypothetical protein NC651_039715 [Populus alba x Populus x berolinensis]
MAMLLFDEMHDRNVVAWNVMITGLVKWGKLEIASFLFDEMPEKNVVSWNGNWKRGFNAFDIIANSIIDTYLKCGCVVSALRFFEDISAERKNLVSWKSIISGHGGLVDGGLRFFGEMVNKHGVSPDIEHYGHV